MWFSDVTIFRDIVCDQELLVVEKLRTRDSTKRTEQEATATARKKAQQTPDDVATSLPEAQKKLEEEGTAVVAKKKAGEEVSVTVAKMTTVQEVVSVDVKKTTVEKTSPTTVNRRTEEESATIPVWTDPGKKKTEEETDSSEDDT